MIRKPLVAIGLLAVAVACASAADKPKIGVVLKALDSEFWLSVKAGAERAGSEHPSQLLVLAPPTEMDVERQITILEDLVSQRVRGIVVSACDVAAVVPPLEKAFQQGIPFVTVDSDAATEKKLAFVGTDNFRGGQLAGEHLARELKGRGKLALVTGVPGQQAHMARRDGFLDSLKKAPGLKLQATQPANSDRALAFTVMENLLQAHPDLDAVFVTNTTMAMGALEAVKAHGRLGRVKVVGFDTSSESLKALARGELSALVAQNPFQMGYLGVKTLLASLAGRAPKSRRLDTGTEMVTRHNVKKYLR